jgi:uncharacterized membrane protein
MSVDFGVYFFICLVNQFVYLYVIWDFTLSFLVSLAFEGYSTFLQVLNIQSVQFTIWLQELYKLMNGPL